MSGRGFSLVETLIACMLLTMLVALTAANLRTGKVRGESHGLGLEIAQELRSARERALSLGHPVGVVFPSANGAQPHSQSYSILEGESVGSLSRQVDLGGNYERAAVFVGLWGLSSGTAQKQPGYPLAGPAMVPLDTWLPDASKRDYCLVFGPDGRLRSNDLPWFDGAVHLLVVNGVQYSAAAAPPGATSVSPGPSYFRADRVGSPWTVTVTDAGEVSLRQGMVRGTLPDETQLDYPGPPVRLAAAGARAGPMAPQITSLDSRPHANPLSIPPGCDATVPLDSHLSLTLTAVDPDGDQLFCQWTADGGAFSSASQDRMVWDVASASWKAEWQWRPPGTAAPGDRYELTYRVYDSRGQVAAPFGAAILTVEATPVDRLVFTRENPPGASGDLWIVNSDGTGLRNLTNSPANENIASASADGTRLSYFYGATGNCFVMNVDGTNRVQVAGGGNYDPVLSPQGNLVAFTWRAVGSDYQIWGMLPDGSNRHAIADMTWTGGLSTNMSGLPSFSPDGSRLVYAKHDATWDLYTVNVDGTSPTLLASTPGTDQKPVWGNDGWIWFVSDQDGNQEIYKVREDGSSLTRVTNSPEDDEFVGASADGTRISSVRNGDIYMMDADGTNLVQVTQGPEYDYRPVWLR